MIRPQKQNTTISSKLKDTNTKGEADEVAELRKKNVKAKKSFQKQRLKKKEQRSKWTQQIKEYFHTLKE